VTEHPFELVVLTSEEPNTFGISTFGSRGMVGKLKKEELQNLKDDEGNDFPGALAFIGGALERIEEAVRKPNEIAYFVELHIEQMPYLEREGKDIGVVAGVTGIYREHIRVRGEASHCGTTPMSERRDALCAASRIILALEAAAREEEGKAVATVGHINMFPNSINITPGLVEMDAEIRSYHPDSMDRIATALHDVSSMVQRERNVQIEQKILYETPSTPFSQEVREAIGRAAEALNLSTMDLVSMAGHDAAHMNTIAPSGMLFIPCKEGKSHCPEEWTETKNMVNGSQCLLKTLLILDGKREGA
jgi:N-carbamoyl-L-amino-acid hydrolase